MRRRISITLPEGTVLLLDLVAKRGQRSRHIADAVKRDVASQGRDPVRSLLKRGAMRRAGRDLSLAEEWFNLDAKDWSGTRR